MLQRYVNLKYEFGFKLFLYTHQKTKITSFVQSLLFGFAPSVLIMPMILSLISSQCFSLGTYIVCVSKAA